MISLFYDFSVDHYQNRISNRCTGETVGNKDTGLIKTQFVELIEDLLLCHGIQRSGRFIQDQDIGIGIERWNRLMKGAKPLNYDWLVRRIKKHLPDLYEALGLDFYNPYEEQTRVTRTHYILVHSSIEYFIHK